MNPKVRRGDPQATSPEAGSATDRASRSDSMRDAALGLAAIGWKVFPCIPFGPKAKAPYTKNGFHDATSYPGVIKSWWTKWPRHDRCRSAARSCGARH
jgi:hypothetical protein